MQNKFANVIQVLIGLLLLTACFSSLIAQDQRLQWSEVTGFSFPIADIGEIRWMKEGSNYTSLLRYQGVSTIFKVDISKAESRSSRDFYENSEVIFAADQVAWPDRSSVPTIDNYSLSANEQFILLSVEQEAIWRRSRKAHYYIYNRESKEIIRLYESDAKQSLAEFSPDYQSIAFVANRNLFIHDLSTGQVKQITHDGSADSIINGATDWVYEEEFYLTKAWVWTADSKSIVYLKFDESQVPLFTMEKWGDSYSDFTSFKYPRAGEKNAIVTPWVYNLDTDSHQKIELGELHDWYIPRIYSGKDGNDYFLIVTNRLQNQLKVLRGRSGQKMASVVLDEEGPYWLDMTSAFEITDDGSGFLWMSDRSGWNHLYLKYFDQPKWEVLTAGEWEVDKLLGFDQKNGKVYFTSTKDSPIERQLYSVDVKTKELNRLTNEAGWHSITFSNDFSYYIDQYSSNAQVPRFSLHKADGEEIRLLEENAAIEQRLSAYQLPEKKYMQVPNEQGDSLLAYMIYPPDFSEQKQYPMLMFVYGGPRSQQVQNRFSFGQRDIFHHYLATQGILVACVDGRGTGARGRDFKKQIYKRLGELETKDQVAAASYFGALDYVDEERIGIWGWSYGGYMSTLSLAYAPDVFKAATAVAPVTHWKWYDTIYTERFMQTPQQNQQGYEAFAPINMAGNIQPHTYLLIHGSGDDNVHYQHSVAMADALIEQNVPFQLMMYPNRNHGIYGGNTRQHLYTTIRDFFMQQFDLPLPKN